MDRAFQRAGDHRQLVGRHAAQQPRHQQCRNQGPDQCPDALGGQQTGPGGIGGAVPIAVGPEQEGPQPTQQHHVGNRADQQADDLAIAADHPQETRHRPGGCARGRHRHRHRGDRDGRQGDHQAESGECRAEPGQHQQPAKRRPNDLADPVGHRTECVASHRQPIRRDRSAQRHQAGHNEQVQRPNHTDQGLQQSEAGTPGQHSGQAPRREHRRAGDANRAEAPLHSPRERRQHHFRQHAQSQAEHQHHAGPVSLGNQDRQRGDDAPASQVKADHRQPVGPEAPRAQQRQVIVHRGTGSSKSAVYQGSVSGAGRGHLVVLARKLLGV